MCQLEEYCTTSTSAVIGTKGDGLNKKERFGSFVEILY